MESISAQGWKADVLADALARAVTALPAQVWASLVWDRATEMATLAQALCRHRR
jgi:IS30 family transposase